MALNEMSFIDAKGITFLLLCLMTGSWIGQVWQTPESNQSICMQDSHFKGTRWKFRLRLGIFWKSNWQFLVIITIPLRDAFALWNGSTGHVPPSKSVSVCTQWFFYIHFLKFLIHKFQTMLSLHYNNSLIKFFVSFFFIMNTFIRNCIYDWERKTKQIE